jgi:hypothetical protein
MNSEEPFVPYFPGGFTVRADPAVSRSVQGEVAARPCGLLLGLPNHRRCGSVAGMYTSQKKIEQPSNLPRSFSEVTARDIVGMIVGALLGYLMLVYW